MKLTLNDLDYTVPVGRRSWSDYSVADAERIFRKGLALCYRQKAKALTQRHKLSGDALRAALDEWTPPDNPNQREQQRKERLREAAKGFSVDVLLDVLGVDKSAFGPKPAAPIMHDPPPYTPFRPSGGIVLPPPMELDDDKDKVRP